MAKKKLIRVLFNYAPSEHLVFVRFTNKGKSYEYKVDYFRCFVPCWSVLEIRPDKLKRSMHMEADCTVVNYIGIESRIELH